MKAKTQTYEKWQKGSFKKDISNQKTWLTIPIPMNISTIMGNSLDPQESPIEPQSTGYCAKITIYECEDCLDCLYKTQTTKKRGSFTIF